MNDGPFRNLRTLLVLLLASGAPLDLQAAGRSLFNVKDYGATGHQADDARPAIQKAIDACAAAGGGMVYLPPGEYTSGTLHLRSHLRFEIEAGATLFASADPRDYEFGQVPSKAALLYGENLDNVSIGGRGTVDGQAEYEWREDDYERAFDHKTRMQTLGKSLMRSFPKGFPKREVFPHLVWLGQSKDVQIRGLSFRRAPSWTMALYACEQVGVDGLAIESSLEEGVWADGIDLDGCRDVSIANCRIETGDDCIVFISTDAWGPARACENITVFNCRLASASAGIKFSEGNRVGIRRVVVSNTIFSKVNRGLVFTVTLGGEIRDVLLSDLVINCHRFDWFWSGDGQPFHFKITRLSEFNHEAPRPGELPPGTIRDVTVRNVTAHAKGSSLIQGHAESWLERITFENVRLFMSADPAAPFDRAEHGLQVRWARDLKLEDVSVRWERPTLDQWKSALYLEDIDGLDLDGFTGRAAWPDRDQPAVWLENVSDAFIRNCRAPDGTKVFLKVSGKSSRAVCLQGSDFPGASIPFQLDEGVATNAVKSSANLLAE